MKNLNVPLFSLVLFLALSGTARAANPSVVSFSVSPSSISHGQPVNISWTVANGGGHSLLVTCPQAVTLTSAGGNSFPCNSRTSISSQASDAATIVVSNNSGVLKPITVTIIPKDAAGTDYDVAQQSTTINVGANQNPVSSFTVATSTISTATTTVSWTTATGVPGTNITIGCTTNDLSVVAPSLGSGQLYCGTNISPSDLPANGSLDIVFTNSSPFDVPVPINVIPAIISGSYDAIHGVQNTIVVKPAARIEPAITSFTASSTQVLSGGTTLLSWTTSNAYGVNLKFGCSDIVSVAKIVNGATTTVACSNLIFDQALAGTSAVVSLTNSSYSNQNITASLLPAYSGGTYNGLNQKDIILTVLGMGVKTLPTPVQTAAPVVTTPAAAPATVTLPVSGCVTGYLFSPLTGQACQALTATTAQAAVAANTPVPVQAKSTFVFKKPLARGSKGEDVTALQEFFAKYPETYGNVSVTGYFGPATEKLVMKFQEKYNVTKKGRAGYGLVGPATRARLNSLQ